MSDVILKNVVKNYGGRFLAVNDLTTTFKAGEFVCLLGPSGCGKTTTLRMIAGLERPNSGELLFGDRVFFSSRSGEFLRPEKRNLGLMFQSYALWPHMTVEQNVVFGLSMRKATAAEKASRFEELAKLFHLDGLGGRYPRELSGGQQQRVALARMLAVNPSLLLLDEPLSNLDAALRLEMRAELKRLHNTLGCTVIFVTHDQLEAMTMATTIAVMNKGVIEQMARPMDIYHRPATRFVANFVGNPPMNMVDARQGDDLAAWLGNARPFPARTVETFGVRPEALRMAAPGAGAMAATIDTIQPTGADWIVGLAVAGRPMFALSAEPPPAAVGETVGLTLKADGVHAFDGEGRNLEAVA
ncbi:ABC transporter ATP-binding protein (plasmid) [Shinella sp. PSBB067]|uniref:ABC transporter ATP-binding protein n=1 Tax=Shinella sp. PSBB067 TaxID=2715959 RepID=UPI00193C348A|nr:ABC transporter ATP-binding protein [Shinella sp. PSBB067]QRI66181.1 ABC transporter ATP-binding protein [Shinella sp. PSBB067]